MDIFLFAFFPLKVILVSEGAGTSTGEAKITLCIYFYPYLNLEYLFMASVDSFTNIEGGFKILKDDYYGS